MAIAFVSSTASSLTNGQTRTISHTIASGSDRVLIVVAGARSDTSSTHRVVSTVTFDGSDLTRATNLNGSSGGTSGLNVEIWYMVNPPVKTANVVVTFTGSTLQRTGCVAANFTGVDQSSPIANSATANQENTASPTVSVNTSVDNAWVLDIQWCAQSKTVSASSPQNEIGNVNISGPTSTMCSSYKGPIETASSTSMTWGAGASTDDWLAAVVALRPAAAAVTHTYSGSGGATSGGAAGTQYVAAGTAFPYSGSGGATSGGTADASRIAVFTVGGSGGAVSGGSAAIAVTHSYSGSGSSAAGGTAAIALTRTYSGSGSSTAGGAAETNYAVAGAEEFPYSGSGGSTAGGSADVATVRVRAYSGSGSAASGGAASAIFAPVPELVAYAYAGAGGIASDGAASCRLVSFTPQEPEFGRRRRIIGSIGLGRRWRNPFY